jgi:diacylglycerol kinase family enzyme
MQMVERWPPRSLLPRVQRQIDVAQSGRPLPANYYRKVLLDAARVLAEGRTVAVDVGEVSGRYFLMWAGIGLDTAILESISPKEKRALGTWAYVVSAVGLGYRYSGTDVYLNLDGKFIKTNLYSTP